MSLRSDEAGAAPAETGRSDRDLADPQNAPASNVIPFVRPRRHGDDASAASLAPIIAVEVRTVAAGSRGDWRFAAVLAGSLLAHAGAYWLLNRPPEPLASIGLEAMDVEIVLGADTPAGLSSQSSETEAQPAPPAEEQAQSAPTDTPATKEAEPPKPPGGPAATADSAPETPERTASLADPAPDPTPVSEPQPTPPEKTESTAAPETPTAPAEQPAVAATTPEPPAPVAEAPAPPPPAPVAEAPAPPATLAMREPEPAPPKPKPPAQPAARPEPPKTRAPAEPKPSRHAERTGPTVATPAHETGQERTRQAALPSAGSSGIGRGRSDASSNYPGLVAAHLARYKRFPSDARARGEQGVATVRFTLDGGGRVSSVALVRPSGNAALDRESQDVVHRASPFPAPPDGQAKSFTIPVRFSLN